jgi:hypothetical protein
MENKEKQDRLTLLRAMNEVANAVTDVASDFYEEFWIDLTPEQNPYELDEYTNEQIVEMGLIENTKFVQVMDNFLHLMTAVANNGGGICTTELTSTVGNEDE